MCHCPSDDPSHGFVYRWTDATNGMMYVGSHNGKNPRYVGSGLTFWHAVRKHGIENFSREILYCGSDYRDEEERILVALNAAGSPRYYNLKNQALGVVLVGTANPMHHSNGYVDTEETRYRKGWSRGKKRPDQSVAMAGERNPMYGQSRHTHGVVAYAKSTKGKTYEEIHGAEAAAVLRSTLAESQRGKKHRLRLVTCPHCSKTGAGPNMTRYHFGNCRKKEA